MKILTDIVLRAHWFKTHDNEYVIEKDTMLTPAAKDFIKEHDIRLVYSDEAQAAGEISGGKTMTVVPPQKDDSGKTVYIDEATGKTLLSKPEHMTHLYGNHLVGKTHPRILFRGRLDSLAADILKVQTAAQNKGESWLVDALSQVLDFVRELLSAEVLDKPLKHFCLLGLDSESLRYESHHVKEVYGISHPTPEYTMGDLCAALNGLRTKVRETELFAVHAFLKEDKCEREDIVEALNRLSSCIYILFLRMLTGKRRFDADALKEQAVSHKTDEDSKEGREKCRRNLHMPEGFLVEASGRHVHLTKEAVKTLFGKETLTKKSDLSQPGQFAAEERVTLMTSKGEFENVAVLGPERSEVQVELSLTDARILGLTVPVNLSGDLKGAADIIIVGPAGIYNAVGAVIAAKAHIHMTPRDALFYGVEDGDSVAVKLDSRRPVTLDDVIVRVSDKYSLAMHLDYDEANAASFKKGDKGYIIGKEACR